MAPMKMPPDLHTFTPSVYFYIDILFYFFIKVNFIFDFYEEIIFSFFIKITLISKIHHSAK